MNCIFGLQYYPLKAFNQIFMNNFFCSARRLTPVVQRFSAMCLILLVVASTATAQGDLLISPLRIVFENTKRSQEVSLANVGKDTAVYAVSVKNLRMRENGAFEEITVPDSGQLFADHFIRYFPRKVTLAPNESQVVKIQLIRTSQMTEGEYRSHLYFRAVPQEKPLGEEKAGEDTAGIAIQLKPIFGITIPVIIRKGENDGDVTLSDLSVDATAEGKPVINVSFNRTGKMSVYGTLRVFHIDKKGKSVEVKLVKGLGVYTPNTLRMFSTEMDTDKGVDYSSGRLHLVYTLQNADDTEKEVEAYLDLSSK